jgi:hypothetical protein
MNLPKMAKVFVIREANVTTLAQMNKIPISVANMINDFDRKNAPVLAKIFADRYMPPNRNFAKKEEESQEDANRFLEMVGAKIQKFLNKNGKGKEELPKLAKENWREFLQTLNDFEKTEKNRNIVDRAEMKFPDGFYWVRLENRECSAEGEAMQHCGEAMGDMYSLRDPHGNSHVTMDVLSRSDGSWGYALSTMNMLDYQIPKDVRLAIQIRGKQNKTPDRKYWQYIKDFLNKNKIWNADMIHGVGESGFDEFIGGE